MPREAAFQMMEQKVRALEEQASLKREELDQLRESEARYRRVFEESGAPAIIIRDDMTIVMANHGFQKLVGYSKSEINGQMKWPEVVAAKDVERMVGYHYGRREGKQDIPIEYECQLVTRFGDVRDMLAKVSMLPGPRQSIASFMDITERKRAERALAESESRLRGIVDASQGFIYTCSGDMRIEFMNPAMVRHLGRDATGEPCCKALFDLDSDCWFCGLDEILAGRNVRREIKSPRDDRWYYMIASPIRDRHGRVTAKQTMMVDITERKLEQEALKESEESLRKENIRLRTSMSERFRFGGIVGKSPGMQAVYDLILDAAATDASVIVNGESGTGKELVARAIHDLSDRKEEPFVVVHCGAVPENLLESEFFGYKKGAFTGASMDMRGYLDTADKGTLFLDEIGEIGANMQIKLLRAIDGGGFTPLGGGERKHPDIRIIAATHRDLQEHVDQGRMRADFYYRIQVVPIRLPPLRDRKEDIPLLVEHFISAYEEEKRPPITGRILDALTSYDWPGNVRELQNALHRYVTLKRLEIMGRSMGAPKAATQGKPKLAEGTDLREAVAVFEKQHLLEVLEKNKWSRTRAASDLGINRKTLFKKMRTLGID